MSREPMVVEDATAGRKVPDAGHTTSYYLALFQMRDDSIHHHEDNPIACVTGLVLPASDAEIAAAVASMGLSLTDWLQANRERFA